MRHTLKREAHSALLRRALTLSAPSECLTMTSSIRATSFRHLALVLPFVAIASFGCAKEQDGKEQHLSRANDYFAANQYDKAEKEYREVFRFAPDDPVAVRQLAIIYLDQGQVPQAYPLLKKAAELEPDNQETQLKLGEIFLAMGDYTQARDTALQILEKQPGQDKALLLLAYASRKPEDIEETRKLVQSLREKEQDRPSYHLALGVLDLRQNDQTRAEGEFKAALNLDSKSADALASLGGLYWARKDLKEADQALKTAADLAPPRSPIRLRYVDFKFQTGAASEAKQILEDMSQKLPDYLPPRVYLMKMACAEQQDEGCATRVQGILAQDPTNFDALYLSGSRHLTEGDAEKAVREFEQLGSTYGRNPQVRYQLARAYLLYANGKNAVTSRNLVDAAENNLNVAIQLNPQFDPATLLLAELKFRKGNPAAAVDLLVPLTKERPQIAQAQYLLASAYLAQQKRDQALAVYRQMTELFPKDPQPSLLMGAILQGQGQQHEARKAFEKSVDISPDYLPAIEKLVDLDIAQKQYPAAMDRVQGLIDKDPKLAQPWALRAKIYLVQRDFTRAEPDLLKAIDLDSKLEPAYDLLAQLYLASNRPEEAIAKLSAFVEKNNAVPALMKLAMINEALKHFDAARDAYEKVLTIAPNLPLALNNLAVLYSEQLGQLDKAYDLAKRAKEVLNQPHIADTLGWILFKKRDYSNALPLLQEAASKLPHLSEVQYHVGMAHYMVGEDGPARVALQKALDGPADFRGKDEARRRLSLLAIPAGTASAATVRTELENYLRESPNDPAALVRLAAIQRQDGAMDQAVKTYEKVIADNPLYAPALRQLALLYGNRPTDDPRAYELVTKAREAYPDDPEIAKTLGILNYRRGNYPQSEDLLKQAAAKRKEDPVLLYYLGAVYHQLKQYAQCKETLQEALSSNLSPELGGDATKALADCTEMAPQ
jgi:tetratricopeptide (TPR) repeat protein